MKPKNSTKLLFYRIILLVYFSEKSVLIDVFGTPTLTKNRYCNMEMLGPDSPQQIKIAQLKI